MHVKTRIFSEITEPSRENCLKLTVEHTPNFVTILKCLNT
jgi:hypothetical protein